MSHVRGPGEPGSERTAPGADMRSRASGGPETPAANPVRVRFDVFELDEADARLVRDGQPIGLAPTPFAVLCALAKAPGALFTKDALLDAVWGHRFVSESVLKTAVSELRMALGDDARNPRFVETVSRRGYRFIAPIRPATTEPRAAGVSAGSTTGSSIIGRAPELARLHAAWGRALDGARTIVWVTGDPGVGKTALIDQFATELLAAEALPPERRNAAIARGQCVEQYGAGEPYLPILDALADLCHTDDRLPALLRAVAPSWLLQLPWVGTAEERDALRREFVGVRLDRMLRELCELLDRYTEQRPLLLVTEDLHWSDQATVQLMDYIARRRGHGRLMWLATFRLAEIIAHDHPLKAVRSELKAHGLCEEIVLDPFSEEEVADYVSRHASSLPVSESFVRALHTRTDGLPLFVAHVVNDLVANNDREEPALCEVANIAIPENLAGIIDHYVSRLTSEQRVVLEAGAVCGVDFRVATVAGVLEGEVASIAATCEELARGQLWLNAPDEVNDAANPSYTFKHALFRQSLYERIGPHARGQLHRKVGAALELDRARGAPVLATELAMHFERGGEPIAALRHYVQATESALPVSAVEAMRLTERGLSLVERAAPGNERDALELGLCTLRGLAAVHVLGVGAHEAKTALTRAFALLPRIPQHSMRGLLVHELGWVLCMRGEYAEACSLARHALELANTNRDPVLLVGACAMQGDVHMLRGQPRLSREWAEKGLTACDALPDNAAFLTEPRVALLGLLAIQLLHLGHVEQARARLVEARTRAREFRQPMAQAVAIWFDGLFQVRLGNVERVNALANEMAVIVDEFAFAQGHAACRWLRGWAQAHTGDLHNGARLIREAYDEDVRLGMRTGGSEMLGLAAEALVAARDWVGAQRELDAALELVSALGERVYLPQLLLTQAAIAHARGDEAAAQNSMRRALAEAREHEAPWLELIALLAINERGAARAEERAALATLVEQLPEAIGTAEFARARTLLTAGSA